MKRLYAARFLAINSFPHLKGRGFTDEKNRIDGLVNTAIAQGKLKVSDTDDISAASFLWWASEKNKNKTLYGIRVGLAQRMYQPSI